MDTTERSSYDLVVELLNQASLETTGPAKVILLKQVQELIINKEPNLLDNFFDEMLGFQSDKSVDVRKFVISFLESACRVDGDILSKIIGNLNILLYDDNVNIKKKVMLSMASLYKTAIKWISSAKIVTEVMEETWKYLTQMRDHIVTLLDDDNDGIRTHSVKFAEAAVMALSTKSAESAGKSDQDQSLETIPDGEHFFDKTKLEEDGRNIFKQMIDFLGSQTITSVNLMACMMSMTNLAKKRPQFMTQVIEGFEALHVNLPPTLSNSQVSSVRKSLKLQMLAVLKHPSAADLIPQIATLLTDLGATQSEVNKAMPRPSELAARRKRKAESEAEQQRKKAPKTAAEMPSLPLLPDVEEEDDEPPVSKTKEASKPFNPVDTTTEDIIPKLSSNNVADLVLLSMVMLPDEMPAHFQSTYTPIAAAGTPGQIKHISRLLAVQLNNVGLGKGFEEQKIRDKAEEEAKKKEAEKTGETSSSIQVVGDAAVTAAAAAASAASQKAQFTVPLLGTTRKAKAFDLESVTKPLSHPVATNLITMALQRIYKAEGEANKANLSAVFCKIASGMTSLFEGFMRDMMFEFIFSDCKNRADLALTWVYSEYVKYQGFTLAEGPSKPSYTEYEECISGLLLGLLQISDQPGSAALFVRLILESPLLPDSAIGALKHYCTDEKQMYIGMHTLSELILKRPVLSTRCLYVLLDFTYHEQTEVRNTAIEVTKDLYESYPKLSHLIDEFCKSMLRNLLASNPSVSMFPALPKSKFEVGAVTPWNEFFIKQSLYLYLSILPDQASYMQLLAEIYVKASSDIKRVILRLMEAPIKQLGMDSTELLDFIRTSPKGSETLITRIIHILTERQAPSAELVEIVKVLYQERVADVRFIIPVLNGLQKSEIMAALPRLIKLSPVVVKEVFNRLLGVGGHVGQDAALTPSELMVALHNMDPNVCDIKSVIKATTMCFQEKSLFTQEVLAVVIQQLMEVTPIPTLLMRTIIQSLTMYPKLQGFILNMLQRLIQKQVWKHKKIWEGFVRCCQRAKPQSFQILLQLAPAQLKMAFDTVPDLRQPLLKHVNSFSAHQRAHLPKALLAVIEQREDQPANPKTEPVSQVKAEPVVKTEPIQQQDTASSSEAPTTSVVTVEDEVMEAGADFAPPGVMDGHSVQSDNVVAVAPPNVDAEIESEIPSGVLVDPQLGGLTGSAGAEQIGSSTEVHPAVEDDDIAPPGVETFTPPVVPSAVPNPSGLSTASYEEPAPPGLEPEQMDTSEATAEPLGDTSDKSAAQERDLEHGELTQDMPAGDHAEASLDDTPVSSQQTTQEENVNMSDQTAVTHETTKDETTQDGSIASTEETTQDDSSTVEYQSSQESTADTQESGDGATAAEAMEETPQETVKPSSAKRGRRKAAAAVATTPAATRKSSRRKK